MSINILFCIFPVVLRVCINIIVCILSADVYLCTINIFCIFLAVVYLFLYISSNFMSMHKSHILYVVSSCISM